MLQYVSKNLTDKLIYYKIIDSGMADIYQYGFELWLSTLLTSSTILLVACLMDSLFFGFLYFCITIPLRMTTGGYHSPTYSGCFLISNATYIAVSLLTKYLSALIMYYSFWFVLLSGSTLYILANCPVKNPHHPVSAKVLKKNRLIAILYLLILCYLMVLFYIMLQQSYILNFIVITVLSVAILILPTKSRKEDPK